MPLDPLQEEVAWVALHLAEGAHVVLAGGGAMLAHEFVDRPTMDLDLFTSEAREVGPVTDALREALRNLGHAVEVTRREETFSHLQVAATDGRHVDVDVAQDARMLPAVQLAVGAVLHPDELAADKTLALFGRGAARDLVDVDALAGRYGRQRLLELAAAKDPGFDPGVFAAALAVAAGRSTEAFAELGVDERDTAGLRERATAWGSDLTHGADTNGPSNPIAPADPTAAAALDEGNTMTSPASLADVLGALDVQEVALGRMEERVSRLEAAAGGQAGGDLSGQRDVAQGTDHEQALESERERLRRQGRELGR